MVDLKTGRVDQRGSYTVEAALILPIVLMALMTVALYAIDMHDKIILSAVCRQGAYEVLKQMNPQAVARDDDLEALRKLALKTLIQAPENLNFEMEAQHTLLESQGRFRSALRFERGSVSAFSLLGISRTNQADAAYLVRYTDPAAFVRKIDFCDDLTNRVKVLQPAKAIYQKGADELKKLMEEWL